MAINFPSSPTSGDTYVYGDFTYAYDGEKWTSQGTLDEEYVKTSGGTMTGILTVDRGPDLPPEIYVTRGNSSMHLYHSGNNMGLHSNFPNGEFPSSSMISRNTTTGDILIGGYIEDSIVEIHHPTALEAQVDAPAALTRKDYVDASIPTRKKSECHWIGLNHVLTAGVPVNIITLLNQTVGASGSWAPMFNPTTGKLTPFNDDRTVTFKLNLIGSFSGGSTNRALQLDFFGTVGNRMVVMRDSNISPSPNSIQFATFFSVDKDGNMATNGTEPMVTALGGNFTITEALIIAEQVTTEG